MEVEAARIVTYVIFNSTAAVPSLSADEVDIFEAGVAESMGLSDDFENALVDVEVQCVCAGTDVCPKVCDISTQGRRARALQGSPFSSILAVKYRLTLPMDKADVLGGSKSIASKLSGTNFLADLHSALNATGRFSSSTLSLPLTAGTADAIIESVSMTIPVCDAGVAPANGQAGTCALNPLRPGESCSIVCSEGWVANGTTVCGNRGQFAAVATCVKAQSDGSDSDEGFSGDIERPTSFSGASALSSVHRRLVSCACLPVALLIGSTY